ncbi:MAG: hypothetical protein JKY56_16210 [Kofleriaceae bacterium]|nr:hypothetical protein [Kofleriaceae bacterium]
MGRTHIALVLLFLGCSSATPQAHQVQFAKADTDNGSITLVFSSPAPNVLVALDGKIVSEGKLVKRLRIDNVPSGYSELAVAAGGGERKMKIWVEAGQNTSVPLAGPPPAPKQSPILQAGLSIFALFVSRAATQWLF